MPISEVFNKERLIDINTLSSRCGYFTSDTIINNGYGCNHHRCYDGVYTYKMKFSDVQKIRIPHREEREFNVKGHKIMAYSRKDAIKRLKHKKLI